jgi:hypothetical protein
VETIGASFVRSPIKSTRRALRELLLPRSTIHKVLHNTQIFKTPSGLCGHTVYRMRELDRNKEGPVMKNEAGDFLSTPYKLK